MGSGASKAKEQTVFDKFDKKNTEIAVPKQRLRDLSTIGRFSLLQKLVLRDNILSTLPEEFAQLKLLKILDLSLNRFEEIPPVIYRLKHIAVLNMDGNMLSTVPVEIKDTESLEEVSLEYNKLGYLPMALFLMPNVTKVKIRGNHLSALPQDLHVRMVYKLISGIFLTDNKFKKIPPEVLGLTHAEELYMDYNLLSSIPQGIRKLSGLKKIEFSQNVISTIPDELYEIPKLEYLSIGHNQIDDISPAIGQAVMLQTLIIRDNRVKTLPEEMKNLKKLKVLDLAQNAIEDFPVVVTEIKSLVTLNMAANHLRFVPPDLSNLIRLKKLGLGHNMLNDDAFETLTTLTWLESLFLENNLIHNIRPEFTEGLKNLKQLSLNGNDIVDIPEELMPKTNSRPKSRRSDDGEIAEKQNIDMFGGKQSFTITPNKEEEEKITISNTFALEIPPEAVTGEMSFNVAYADEDNDNDTDLPLGEGAQQESELIDFTPRSMSFGSLISLVVKLDTFNDPSRDLVIMQKDETNTWKELKTYQDGSLTKVKVRTLSGLVAVTKPHTDEMALGENGGKLESTGVKDVSVSFPVGAVDNEEPIVMEVDSMDTAVTDDSDVLCEARADVTVSPCVTIKGAKGKKHLEFQKEVEVSLPIPPSVPGNKDENTELRVLKDEGDNNIWKDITDELGPIVRHARRASFGIRSFSSYVLARTDPLRRNRAPSFVSNVRRSTKIGRRPATHKVKVLLMQLSIAPQKMVVSVVVSNRLRQKRREFVDAGYSAYGIPYSGDIVLKRGETIHFDVDDSFAFTNENRKCVFYPNRDNTSHVYIEATGNKEHVLNHATGFLKFYKNKSMVAELPFRIFLISEHARRLSRALTDPDMVFEENEDYDFFFSLLAGTLLAPHQQLVDFALRLGLEPEEITKYRNLELRQQVYKMLLLWRQKEEEKSDKAEMRSLLAALRDHRFEDHASTLQTYRRSDPNTDIRGAMRHVACNIDPRDMKMLARYLGLKENEIATVIHDHPNDAREQSYQMLLLWVRRAGSDATTRKLVETMLRIPTLKELSDELVMKFSGMLYT